MLIDAFHVLREDGFRISEYQYTGMGSIYFVDFVLFHKMLHISEMWSVEYDTTIRRRVKYNKPFKCVKIFMEDIADVIPRLAADRQHLLWIDYDSVVSEKISQDIFLACSRLSPGSVLLVTVDVEPPVRDGNPDEWREYFEDEVGRYVPPGTSFAKSAMPRINIDIISNVISAATAGRDVEFFPLFSFLYKDGHQMLTVGGMFVQEQERSRITKSNLLSSSYIRTDLSAAPCEIRVPRLTRKERVFLEGAMPCRKGWSPSQFELAERDVIDYSEIYRFFPVYAELFL